MAIEMIGVGGFGFDLGWRFVIVALKQSYIRKVCGRVRPGVQIMFKVSFFHERPGLKKKSGNRDDLFW